MMKLSCFLLVLLFTLLMGCNSNTTDKSAQNNNDSIKKYIGLAGNNTLDYDKRIKNIDKAYSFIDLTKEDTITLSLLNEIKDSYYSLHQDEMYYKVTRLIYNKSIKTKNLLKIAICYTSFGTYKYNIGENDSSYYYFIKAEKLLKKLNNK